MSAAVTLGGFGLLCGRGPTKYPPATWHFSAVCTGSVSIFVATFLLLALVVLRAPHRIHPAGHAQNMCYSLNDTGVMPDFCPLLTAVYSSQ
jgi:hypothetical protein